MSWSKGTALMLTVLALAGPSLGGCGFRPAYGTMGHRGGAVAELNRVFIEPIADRSGQVLRNHLIDRFYTDGRPEQTDYRLSVSLTAAREDLGIQKNAVATRARLRMTAHYELTETATGKVVYRTHSRSIVSYNLLEAQYATLVAEQDAYERALQQLAEDIESRLALYFSRDKS